MNEGIELDRLVEVDLRQAWAHEAHVFTPWLAEHLDRLSEVIGIPLELEGREIAVEQFAADILARNPQDDTLVLIENQIAPGDHTHLGQIMTYLAGLDARTVIWIASDFREAHLSALKWLNEHTADPFAFFAVRVKVVRIGNSPLAPVFEVLVRPNEWERRLQSAASRSRPRKEAGERRLAFWTRFIERHPDESRFGPARAGSNRWHVLDPMGIVISIYLAVDHVGLFLRGPRGASNGDLYEKLEANHEFLSRRLGESEHNDFGQRFYGDADDPDERDKMIDWLYETATKYETVLTDVFKGVARG